MRVANQFVGVRLQHGTVATLDFIAQLGQIGEKAAHALPDCGTGSQALAGLAPPFDAHWRRNVIRTGLGSRNSHVWMGEGREGFRPPWQ